MSDPDVAEHYLWRISGFGHGVVPGEPDVPVRWDSFALPEGCASFTVSVLESACVDVPLRLSPARAPQPEGKESPAVVPDIAPYEGWFPREVVETGEVRVYRGRSVAEVGIYPVRYDWKNGVVRACSKIVYRVTFGEGGLRSAPEGRIAPDDSFLDNTTLNGNAGAAGYEMFRSAGYTGSAGKDYLILSTPEFEEAVRRLADWKRTLGFGVHTRLRGGLDTRAYQVCGERGLPFRTLALLSAHRGRPRRCAGGGYGTDYRQSGRWKQLSICNGLLLWLYGR